MQIKKIDLSKIHPPLPCAPIFEEHKPSVRGKSGESVFAQPVFLQSEADGYKIWYGFEIISAIKEAGLKAVAAFVIPLKYTFTDAISLVADYILNQRPLIPIEITRFLVTCQQQCPPNEKKTALFKKLTGMDWTKSLEKDYLALSNLEPLFQKYLISKKAPLKTWLLTAELPPACRALMQNLVSACQPSLSIFEEISHNLMEILRRENIASEILVNELNWNCAPDLYDNQRNQKIAELRDLVQARRFPHLTRHRRKIARVLEALDLPASVNLEYDKNYEEPGFIINARIRSVKNLAELHDFINDSRAKLEDLLKIM